MELNELMLAFAADVGLEGLEPDANGAWGLKIDGMDITFADRANDGKLLICADVGEPPAEGREELYDLLLRTMYLGDGTQGSEFSLDDEGKVVLQRTLDLRYLDLAEFKAALEGFVNVLELWRTTVADFRPAVTTEGPAEAAPGLGGFMQV